jgi:hypothetical protein
MYLSLIPVYGLVCIEAAMVGELTGNDEHYALLEKEKMAMSWQTKKRWVLSKGSKKRMRICSTGVKKYGPFGSPVKSKNVVCGC